MLQPWDTMSLSTADLGSVCVASGPVWVNTKHPNRATIYLLYTSLCTGELNAIRKHNCFLCSPFYGRACRWAMLGELKPEGPKGRCHLHLEILYCTPKGRRALLRIPSTEGRSVCLWWAPSKPTGPNGGEVGVGFI